jgi:hypothetical protein
LKSYTTLRGFVTGEEPEDIEPSFAYHATLRIFSESGLDLKEISTTLGLVPTMSGRRGEKIGPRSPPNKGDIWMYRAPVPEEQELEQHIAALWQALKPKTEYLRELKKKVSVDILLGYSANVDHAGITIRHELFEMFAVLELDLKLYIVVQLDSA